MQTVTMAVDQLSLDLANPRMGDQSLENEDAAITYLYENAELRELIQSIGNSGWLDFEPPIVEASTRTVIEGNRRVAALKVLADPQLARRLSITVPKLPHPAATPPAITVNLVKSRKDARDFIGFKHVNGAYKWDSFAKARFAAQWLKEGDDIDDVSRRLGDNHNTVGRLVNGIKILDQAEQQSLFDRNKISKSSFYFSHLYTALPTLPVRDFLGLQQNDNSVFPDDPVPSANLPRLKELMTWLYGQGDAKSVIHSQNPDLKKLVKVLASDRATSRLRVTASLDRAYDEVEDRAQRFRGAFYEMQNSVEEVLGLVSRYDPNDELLEDAESMRFSMERLVDAMKRIHTKGDS